MNLEVIKVTQTHHICWLPPVTRIDCRLQILRESFVGFLLNANIDNMLGKGVGMIKYTYEQVLIVLQGRENMQCAPLLPHFCQ